MNNKMKKIRWELTISGSVFAKDIFEVPDDTSEDEIDEMVRDEVENYIGYDWSEE